MQIQTANTNSVSAEPALVRFAGITGAVEATKAAAMAHGYAAMTMDDEGTCYLVVSAAHCELARPLVEDKVVLWDMAKNFAMKTLTSEYRY